MKPVIRRKLIARLGPKVEYLSRSCSRKGQYIADALARIDGPERTLIQEKLTFYNDNVLKALGHPNRLLYLCKQLYTFVSNMDKMEYTTTHPVVTLTDFDGTVTVISDRSYWQSLPNSPNTIKWEDGSTELFKKVDIHYPKYYYTYEECAYSALEKQRVEFKRTFESFSRYYRILTRLKLND